MSRKNANVSFLEADNHSCTGL